ncbi:hypothetical protein CGCA056_v003625 [Colletotrichum aenigma]|uniref:uncharacterized protein n=1 Tax=Colletotrichum aenigma TaxID=1215731 RepID=UPI00187257C6|nr:uncharacterized protein CGCA056_v003625 [Colletotrichum aenigma]KAF5526325.1 hypothetical protein CGCA056_v003625 [Colletotrichum aenigma]
MAALDIRSLLQTDQPLDPETEAFRQYKRACQLHPGDIPHRNEDETVLAYYGKASVHAFARVAEFIALLTDEQNLQSTGYNLVDQALCERKQGMGILEVATKQRKTLRQISETVLKAQREIRDILVQAEEHAHPEPTRQPVAPESCSRSSVSISTGVSGFSTGPFSATASQSSVGTSLARGDTTRSEHARSDRRSLTPGSPGYDDDYDGDDYEMSGMHDGLSMDDEVARADKIDMEQLKHRGKGHYICPEWRSCQKGGKKEDGGPRYFTRNCMFRQHLQKHSKPHRCNLPGCPNKEGFARKDQLVRHQLNVKHEDPNESQPPVTTTTYYPTSRR